MLCLLLLPIEETLTKDTFIELVLKWNRDSIHPENVISGIEWHGERNVRYGTERLWLDIQEYRNKNIIAVRYEKIEKDGAVWDSDYVINFDERKICIRLERSYKDESLVIGREFSTPYFITTLMKEGYLKSDGILPVLRKPALISDDNLHIISDIINGTVRYHLPVVYVSKTEDGQDPIDVGLLASRLKGIAHVLVQEKKELDEKLGESCEDRHERNGAVGVYCPRATIGHRRFSYHRDSGPDEMLLNRIVRYVIQYSIEQNVGLRN